MQMSVCSCDANRQNRKSAKQQFARLPKSSAMRQSIPNILCWHAPHLQNLSKSVVDPLGRCPVVQYLTVWAGVAIDPISREHFKDIGIQVHARWSTTWHVTPISRFFKILFKKTDSAGREFLLFCVSFVSSPRAMRARAVSSRQSPTVGPGKDFQKQDKVNSADSAFILLII